MTYHTNNASIYDWIGAYSFTSNTSTINSTFPVKYGQCYNSASLDYLTTGIGTLYFNLTNLRADVQFYYFHGNASFMPYNYNDRYDGAADYVLMNTSDTIVSFRDKNQPLRQRITATGDYDQFVLSWSSYNSTNPILKWGTSSGQYDNTISATTNIITQESLCGYPANSDGWRDLGLIHSATLDGMSTYSKGTKIYYVYGDADTDNFSPEFIFNTPAQPGDKSTDTVLILYDDLGRGFPAPDNTYTWSNYGWPSISTAERVSAEVAAGGVDAIYHGGDISYAVGFEAVWDFFLDMISPMAGSVLYFTTVGNHESDWPNSASYFQTKDSGGECGVVATTVLPQPAPAEVNAPWWSYDVGMVHMVGMSTEHEFLVGSPQYQWLEDDLKNVNREITPWVIFGGHRAMYINSNDEGYVNSDVAVMNLLIDNVEPLLYENNVNLAFWGHNHCVQRQAAVLNKTVIQNATMINNIAFHENPQATVHMVIGTAGADFTNNTLVQPPEWNELVFHEWGYARVTVPNETMLLWEWVNNTNGVVMDRMIITQSYPIQSWDIQPTKQPTQEPNSDNSKSSSHLLRDGTIAVVCLVLVALIVVAYFYYHRKHYESNNEDIVKHLMPKDAVRITDEEAHHNPLLN